MKKNIHEIFDAIYDKAKEVDFRAKTSSSKSERISRTNFIVSSIEEFLSLAKKEDFHLIQKNQSVFVYNGEYWIEVEKLFLKSFLSKIALKMGVPFIEGKYYLFTESLYNQFLASAELHQQRDKSEVLINLQNGTFVFSEKGGEIKSFSESDFITYQLPFEYNPEATCSLFEEYLNQVLPDKSSQDIIAEYLGYVFTKRLKLEKCLLLYGSGANGKSVLFDIINALLGKENITTLSLENLSQEHNRAVIGNKLLNYGSELRGNIEPDIFKQIVSGEPTQCRYKYGNTFMCDDYAKLMFNCNELPKQIEISEAYFRRFIIIPFLVTVPEEKRDVDLARKIISSELSGIFNWILKGLERILQHQKFTTSEQVQEVLKNYKLESDSVAMFLQEEGLIPSPESYIRFTDCYECYRSFCSIDGRIPLNRGHFSKRLKNLNVHSVRHSIGQLLYLKKQEEKEFQLPTLTTLSTPQTTIFKTYVESVDSVDKKELSEFPF